MMDTYHTIKRPRFLPWQYSHLGAQVERVSTTRVPHDVTQQQPQATQKTKKVWVRKIVEPLQEQRPSPTTSIQQAKRAKPQEPT